MSDDPLDNDIDFSRGQRGKFYRPGTQLRIPIYIEEKLLGKLVETAERKGVTLDDLVSDLLAKDLAIVEALR